MTGAYPYTRVLSIYPCRRGFAFAVLEGRDRLVDWNVAQLGIDIDGEFVRRLQALIEKYRPRLVVFEDCSTGRRGEKTQRRIEAGLSLSRYLDLRTILLTPGETKTTTLSPTDQVKALGIFAAYRDFQKEKWRTTVPVPPHKTTPVTVEIGHDGVSVKPPPKSGP